MRIGMQVWGSHGDIRPMLALAEGLQASGHIVSLSITCVDSDAYNQSISRSGISIKSVASPVIRNKNELAQIEHTIFHESNAVKQVQLILEKLFMPVESIMYQESEKLCAENDLVIGHFFHYPLQTAAEKTGTPYASITLVHSAIPSSYYPPTGFPNVGRIMNNLFWRLVRTVLNKGIKSFPDRLRAKVGLMPAGDLMADVWSSHQLNLIAVSPAICERQSDWPEHLQVCGHLDMPNLSLEGTLSEDLEAFLNNGRPPVYMTFGSAMPSDIPSQKETIELFTKAASQARCRAIIQAPAWHACGFQLSKDIFFVASSPYRLIFSRCVAVVHHGGAGTIQTVINAGVPSIAVAHIAEQKFWANELERLGIAAKAIQRRNLSSTLLGKRVAAIIRSKEMKQKAEELSHIISKENGVNTAVKLIRASSKTSIYHPVEASAKRGCMPVKRSPTPSSSLSMPLSHVVQASMMADGRKKGSKNLSRAIRFITRKMLRTHASEVEAKRARI